MQEKLKKLQDCLFEGDEIISFNLNYSDPSKCPEAIIKKSSGKEVPLYYNEETDGWQ